MKIGSGSWDIQRTNSVYGQFAADKTKQKSPDAQKAAMMQAQPARDKARELQPSDVLTTKELEALKVLFNFDANQELGWYGKNKVQNIHSGFLLDVKG
jgi:hypothetical protein